MATTIPIESLSDPRIAEYAGLRDAELRHRTDPVNPVTSRPGLFMAEGDLVVRRLITSEPRFRPVSIFGTRTRFEALADVHALIPADCPFYVADADLLSGIVGFSMHRGLLALGRRGDGAIDTPESIARRSRLLLVLEDLCNHDNIGGIFRNAAGLGFGGVGVLLSPRCGDPLYRKSLRVSMGHVLGVPYATIADWPTGLLGLRDLGFTIGALTPASDAIDVRRAGETDGRVALVLGTEGAGLSAAVLAAADLRLRIPMTPGVDSLNVSVAAAIAMQALISEH
ncbi:MAG: RNA methyltransferase [Phycisphaeraceae bacterium]|nr:RNA methyltransferase [Phycisphaeraceae bacterium]